MFDMISIGDVMQDIFLEMTDETAHLHSEIKGETCQICFNYADKIPVKAKHDLVGGNSANAAVAFARLGFKSGFYTHIGDDQAGQRIAQDLKQNGVSGDYIIVDKGKESNYSTVINLHAERTILIYHVHRDYALPDFQASRWLYLSSMGQGFEGLYPEIIDYVKEHRVKLVYQPGTHQLNYGARKSRELLKNSEIIFVNKEEAELYLDKEATDNFRVHLDGLLALGPKIAVVTDGTKGAYASDGESYFYLGIIEEAPRIEATGAGDCFASGFTAAIASGEGLEEALRWGQCESSSVIQQIGPEAGLLYRKQLLQLLSAYPNLQAVPLNKKGRPEDEKSAIVPGHYPKLTQ